MRKIRVVCPHCRSGLMVPESLVGQKGKCPRCAQEFEVQLPIDQPSEGPPASLDDVLSWLNESPPQQKAPAPPREGPAAPPPRPAPRPRPRPAIRRRPQPKAHKDAAVAPQPAANGNARFPVRLDHVDDMGAFFRFDSRLLYDENFRASFPQQCLICGAKRPLSVHLVFWSSKLRSVARVSKEAMEARQVYTLRKLSDLTGRDLLEVLDPIENMPEPYSLPFPYYVCSSCSAVGAVVTDVHLAADGVHEICELGISSLPQAEHFVVAVCGQNSEPYRRVREALRSGSGRPWQQLPLTVRIRIRRWYQAEEGERFLMYIPDAEFAKAEAGLAGVVLTDLRLVYHKSLAHLEIPRTQPIEMKQRAGESGTELEIISPNGKKVVLRTNANAIKELQQLMMRTGK